MYKINNDITLYEAKQILKNVLILDENAIKYIYNYKDGEGLIKHIASYVKNVKH